VELDVFLPVAVIVVVKLPAEQPEPTFSLIFEDTPAGRAIVAGLKLAVTQLGSAEAESVRVSETPKKGETLKKANVLDPMTP